MPMVVERLPTSMAADACCGVKAVSVALSAMTHDTKFFLRFIRLFSLGLTCRMTRNMGYAGNPLQN